MSIIGVAIQDAELLLDITEANMLGLVFALPFPFSTTDLLWHDLGKPCQLALTPYRQAKKLLIESTDEATHRRAAALQQEQPGLSLAECSVCCLAHTGDLPMLAACQSLLERCYTPVRQLHDLAWLLNQLRIQAHLNRATAISAVRRLVAVNPRLRATCAAVVRRWG